MFLGAPVFAAVLALGPNSRADTDPRVANLINESGAALDVAALRSIRIIYAKGNIVAAGLSGSGSNRP
jgi:hypothetical protein